MRQTFGIFMIHGLMGSPREYGSLQTTLTELGFRTRTISLPGHGEHRHRPLHDFSAQEIIDHCLSEYHAFAEQCEHVIIVGHSLGGICTLLTASHQPDKLCGIVSLAAPFEHAYNVNKPMDLFKVPPEILVRGMAYMPDQLTGFERPEFHPWMFHRLVEEGNLMLDSLAARVQHIDVPVLLAHSVYDLTIPYTEMDKIQQNLKKAPIIKTHTFEECGHQIFPTSGESRNAEKVIVSFVEEECIIRRVSL